MNHIDVQSIHGILWQWHSSLHVHVVVFHLSQWHKHSGVRQWWPQTMTATNHDDQRHNLVKSGQWCREYGDFLKVRSYFFTFSLLWLSWYTLRQSWFVAIMVGGRHGIGPAQLLDVTYCSSRSCTVTCNFFFSFDMLPSLSSSSSILCSISWRISSSSSLRVASRTRACHSHATAHHTCAMCTTEWDGPWTGQGSEINTVKWAWPNNDHAQLNWSSVFQSS